MDKHYHEKWMQYALALAKKGINQTRPNPMVGCVIVKEGKVIGEGYHACCGKPHAEVEALQSATEDVCGATLYVTLEPCAHFGRTPPCANAIVASGISHVVVAVEDPNPKVAGKGTQILREAGIRVETDVLKEEAQKLNTVFFHYVKKKRPYIILKAAATLDGKIATSTGDSKWITGPSARDYVQKLRSSVAAVLIGGNTAFLDDPMLNVRIPEYEGLQPLRIVLDGRLQLPIDGKLAKTAREIPLLVATTSRCDGEKRKMLEEMGADILTLENQEGRVDILSLMEVLYQKEIDSVLLEGGGKINAAFLEAGLVDKFMLFLAPKLFGSKDSIGFLEGTGVKKAAHAWKIKNMEWSFVGEDVLLEGYIAKE